MSVWDEYPQDYRAAEVRFALAAVRAGECGIQLGREGLGGVDDRCGGRGGGRRRGGGGGLLLSGFAAGGQRQREGGGEGELVHGKAPVRDAGPGI